MSATARNYLAQQSSELYVVQQQISSGRKLHRPADDPAAMRRSLIQKDRLERLEAHETSITHVKSRVQQAQVHLLDANALMTKAREIALQAPQLTDDSERRILAAELNGLIEQMGSLANAADESGYLFSGTAATSQPFTISRSDLAGVYSGRSDYAGAPANTELHIAGDVDRQALLPGSLVFQPMSRLQTVLIGSTGAMVGSGTDSATGSRTLTVSHTATTFSAGSGIQSGSSASTGNTVLGLTGTNVLQVTDTSGSGTSGTISLNGGDPVPFTNSSTDLLVTGPGGERIYLNTTNVTPGFNGTVNLNSTGTVSIDGGLTSTAITFSPNQQITDSRDGTVVNLNTTGIQRAGADQLEFPGTSDVFNVLRELRDDLLNTRSLESSALNASLNRRLSDVERVQDHLLDVIGVQSVSLEQIERLEERTGDLKLAEKLEYGDTIAADVTAAALRLQELNNLQQFTMAAVGQLLTPNLLNYIQ